MKGLKGFLAVLLVVCFCGFLAGCGGSEFGANNTDFSQPSEIDSEVMHPYSDIPAEEGLLLLSFGGSNSRQKDGETPQFRSCIVTVIYPQHPIYSSRGVSLTSETGEFLVTLGLPVGWIEVSVQAETVEGIKYISLEIGNGVEIKSSVPAELSLILVPEEQQVNGQLNIDIDTVVEVDTSTIWAIFPGDENSMTSEILWKEAGLPEGLYLGKEVFAKLGDLYVGKGTVVDALSEGYYKLVINWNKKPDGIEFEMGIRLFVIPEFIKNYLSLSTTTPLSCAVVVGTSNQVFLKFNLTAGRESDIKVLQIPIVRGGTSQDTDVGNLRLFSGDVLVATAQSLVGSRAIFPVDLVVPKGTTKEIGLLADIHSGVGDQISFSVASEDIIAVAMDSEEAVVVSGTACGNAIQVVAGGELVCSSNPDQILGVIQGGESGGFFSTTLTGRLKMSAVMEDIQCTAYNITVDYEGTNEGSDGWFVTEVRVNGRDIYLNSSPGVIFSDTFVEKDTNIEIEVEADVVFYSRDILPEIAIKIDVVPEATGLASSRVLTQENGGVTGEFTAIYARGYLSRDVLQVTKWDDPLGFSLHSGRDVEIKNIVVAVETEGDVEVSGLDIADYRIFIGGRLDGSDYEVPMNIGLASDNLKNFILIPHSFGRGSLKFTIISIDAVADGESVHVVGLPLEFRATY